MRERLPRPNLIFTGKMLEEEDVSAFKQRFNKPPPSTLGNLQVTQQFKFDNTIRTFCFFCQVKTISIRSDVE